MKGITEGVLVLVFPCKISQVLFRNIFSSDDDEILQEQICQEFHFYCDVTKIVFSQCLFTHVTIYLLDEDKNYMGTIVKMYKEAAMSIIKQALQNTLLGPHRTYTFNPPEIQ